MVRSDGAFLGSPSHDDLPWILLQFHIDFRPMFVLQLAQRSLHGDQAVLEGDLDAVGDGDGFVADAGHVFDLSLAALAR
jgi:hypothetical protein